MEMRIADGSTSLTIMSDSTELVEVLPNDCGMRSGKSAKMFGHVFPCKKDT